MEQNFQTSFIPKKPILKESTVYARPVSVFLIISLFVLFTVLIATGGLYFYKGVLKNNIVDKDKSFTLNQKGFEPAAITKFQVLDKRLRASTEILNNHITIVPIFTALEKITMKTVRFTKFSYDLGIDKNTKISIKMSGQAIGYRSVALQSDLFAKNKNLINPVFSNLTLDNSGNVLFDLEFSVDPSFVNYQQILLTQSNGI